MALRALSLILVAVAAEDVQEVPKGPEMPQMPVAHVPNSTSDGNSTWNNFVYCQCGLSCVKQVGSWYIFNMGQSCACQACPEESGNLRGSERPSSSETPAKTSAEQSQGAAAESEGSLKGLKSLKSAAMPETEKWDGANVKGTNLLYCNLGADAFPFRGVMHLARKGWPSEQPLHMRISSNKFVCPKWLNIDPKKPGQCGKRCEDGRQLGLTTYYCFRYSCKPC